MKAARYQAQFDFFDPEKFGQEVVYMDIGQVIRSAGLPRTLVAIAEALRETQPAAVVIDSFKAIHDLAPSPAEMRTFIFDLAVELAAVQATSFLLGEYSEDDIMSMPEMAVADGIIWLTAEKRHDQLVRHLRILKMRGVNHSTVDYTFGISYRGIELFAVNGLEPSVPPGVRGLVTKTGLP